MRVALAQIAPTVGDLDGNGALVRETLTRAAGAGADLVVFPEMCLTGYPPHDLLERSHFIERCLDALQAAAAATLGGPAAIVGFVECNPDERGKPLYNSAALLVDGAVTSVHHKVLLPTYDVFDEARYFEPGGPVTAVEFAGRRLGICICEDAWALSELRPRPLYERDPLAELVDAGADLLINLSASPFTLPKRDHRPEMLADAARRLAVPLLFVNQVGGNDDLVFDGHSLAFGPDGRRWARGPEFEDALVVVDLDRQSGPDHPPCADDEEAVIAALTRGTRDYAHRCGFRTALVGLSGGIDSTVVAAIAARALGPENVWGVAMPTRYSSEGSRFDAETLAHNLGIHFDTLPIDELFAGFLDELRPLFGDRTPDVTEENLQARIRAVVLMALSNKHGHLLLTTGNKSEVATGYCTLYGDMAGGLAVISDVPKMLVYRVARALNRQGEVIPATVIDKPPSAELAPDQTDQDSLPPYPLLDEILEFHIEGREDQDALVARGYDPDVVRDVIRRVRVAEHKRRQGAPGLKITSKAFGAGRRMPIAQRWRG